MPATATPKFTLRFRNQRNHEILGLLAERFGMSKNQLAEEMLERELQAAALLLESDLTGTLELLKRYSRTDHVHDAIAEFARAEAYEDDPLKTEIVSPASTQDAYGIASAFG